LVLTHLLDGSRASGATEIVEQTVTGLGYDLVEIERSAGGLLRITIDLPWVPGAAIEQFVTVEDCEKVTRQLQFALEVDGVEYKRLEVSSPGIDRPLRSEQDFERLPVRGDRHHAEGADGERRRRARWRQPQEISRHAGARGAGGWQIVWSDEPAVKPGQKVSKKRAPAPLQALGFTLDELREARLAPDCGFQGRRPVWPATG
jgi:ribosome maturation factor RimP